MKKKHEDRQNDTGDTKVEKRLGGKLKRGARISEGVGREIRRKIINKTHSDNVIMIFNIIF